MRGLKKLAIFAATFAAIGSASAVAATVNAKSNKQQPNNYCAPMNYYAPVQNYSFFYYLNPFTFNCPYETIMNNKNKIDKAIEKVNKEIEKINKKIGTNIGPVEINYPVIEDIHKQHVDTIYTATFDVDGDTSLIEAQTVTNEGEITLPEYTEIVDEAYTVAAWTDGSSIYEIGATYDLAADVEFSAILTEVTDQVEVTENEKYYITQNFSEDLNEYFTFENCTVEDGETVEYNGMTFDKKMVMDDATVSFTAEYDSKVVLVFAPQTAFYFDGKLVMTDSNGVFTTAVTEGEHTVKNFYQNSNCYFIGLSDNRPDTREISARFFLNGETCADSTKIAFVFALKDFDVKAATIATVYFTVTDVEGNVIKSASINKTSYNSSISFNNEVIAPEMENVSYISSNAKITSYENGSVITVSIDVIYEDSVFSSDSFSYTIEK